MRLHSSSPFGDNYGAARPTLLHRVGVPVVVGSVLAAALVAFAWTNSRSSSSCETDSSAAGSQTGMVCDTAGVRTATAGSPAEIVDEATSPTNEPDHAKGNHVVEVPAEATSTDPPPVTPAPGNSDHAHANPEPTTAAPDSADATQTTPDPTTPEPDSADAAQTTPDPTSAEPDSADPAPADPTPASYNDITTFGVFHGTSSHTHGDSLAGGRTPITTEALVAYNDLRAFVGLDAVELEAIGRWAFANDLTNNGEAYEKDLSGVGLYYGMQGAKVGWIRDDAFDPQILADIQRTARRGDTGAVMTMVEAFGHPGYADHLNQSGLVGAFINTLKMEPHYGGWMHGRVHGALPFSDGTGASVATSHDLNHLTVLSHDQTEPFMNDTFDWPQWPALDVPEPDVIDYFQSMVVLDDPRGDTQL